MNAGISRNDAVELLKKHVKNENMIKHCFASEAVLRAIAKQLGEDVDVWGIAGLLHDVDVEVTNADPKTHGVVAVNILKENGVADEIIDAITRHNEDAENGLERESKFHFALAAGETITGLITATTLVYPDKKIRSVKPKSVVKRMKEKAFAASVKRENILECEKIGISINDFAVLAINAMCEIDEQLGL